MAVANCKYCGEAAGLLRSRHGECHKAFRAARIQVVDAVYAAMRAPIADLEPLRTTLAEVATRGRMSDQAVKEAVAEGWSSVLKQTLLDQKKAVDIVEVSVEEERRAVQVAEAFGLALDAPNRYVDAVRRRIEHVGVRVALANTDDSSGLEAFQAMLAASILRSPTQAMVPVNVFTLAVEQALNDGLLPVEEEDALMRWVNHFDISDELNNRENALMRMSKAATLRRSIDGDYMDLVGAARTQGHSIPFNLMKSETLVWLEQGVKYHQTKTRREFRGSSQGLSIKVTKGVYYRPSSFKGRSVSYEETVHADTGLLGVTTKHLYFHGERERFRVRYDRIVSFEPYSDGIGIMRDNQRAKPESFSTGDGWFICNLVTNLARR